MNNLSFQHHDVKDSSMKKSRFEKKMQEIKTTFNKNIKRIENNVFVEKYAQYYKCEH